MLGRDVTNLGLGLQARAKAETRFNLSLTFEQLHLGIFQA